MRRMEVLIFFLLFAGCSAIYKSSHCHRPVAGDIRIVLLRPRMVMVEASVHGASDSWFMVGSDKDHLSISSNHEHREGIVVGEFADLPPRTHYVLGLIAHNDCGDTQVIALRPFVTPPPLSKE